MNKPKLETMALPVELAAANGDGRTLKGYASVFNHPIETGEPFTTYVRPGAFTKTLKENGDSVKMLFNHGHDPSIGEKPLGRLTQLKEDGRGLYFEGVFADTSYGRDIMELIRSGSMNGVSIQFEVTQQDWNDERTERNIQQVKLYELGPVTFPANAAAQAVLHNQDKEQAGASSEEDRGTAEVAASTEEDRLTWAKTVRDHETEQESLGERMSRLKEE